MVNNGGNIAKLADKLSDERHAALITSDISRRYFCGFTSSAGIILVTKEASYLLIDFRYFDKAKERVSDCEVILLENAKTQLMNLLIKHGITTVSVESDAMTVTELEKYKANYTFVTFDSSCGLSEMIGKMRIIKTPEEIEKIVKAQRIAERAFSRLLRDIKPGQTEKHVAALLEYYMAEYGSDGKSFDTIAASGVNSASPHAVPTDKKLENGDFLTLDFGATYDGYHSDMTRTIAIDHATDEMEEAYELVLKAQLEGIKALSAGQKCADVYQKAYDVLDKKDMAKYFRHSLGHGVGLDIHEGYNASPRSKDTYEIGNVTSIEPGIYIPNKFGIRIEDLLYISPRGRENLSKITKKLIIL